LVGVSEETSTTRLRRIISERAGITVVPEGILVLIRRLLTKKICLGRRFREPEATTSEGVVLGRVGSKTLSLLSEPSALGSSKQASCASLIVAAHQPES
jgi:hypothetical protein